MDLLNVVNGINAELSQLRIQDERLISEGERVEIFNSVVTALTENLIDLLEFSIRDMATRNEHFGWSYNLSDSRYIQRDGPHIREIITNLNRKRQISYFLDCQVKWTNDFLSLNPRSKERFLEGMIWDEQGKKKTEIQQIRILNNANANQTQSKKFDIREVEIDLRRLQADTELIKNNQIVLQAVDSISNNLIEGYIVGVVLLLLHHGEERPLLDWKYSIKSDSTIIREGKPIEQIVEIVNSIKDRPQLLIKPIFSERFKKMPSESQHLVMQNTIWASEFPKKPKKKWYQ